MSKRQEHVPREVESRNTDRCNNDLVGYGYGALWMERVEYILARKTE